MRIVVTATAFIASVGLTAAFAAIAVEHFEHRPSRARFLVLLLIGVWLVLTFGAALFFLTREIYDQF